MAMLSLTIFMVVMALISFYFGFGLNRGERVVLSMGMGTRNIAAVFIGVLALPDVTSNMVAMVIIWTVWSFILSLIVAPLIGKRANKVAAGGIA